MSDAPGFLITEPGVFVAEAKGRAVGCDGRDMGVSVGGAVVGLGGTGYAGGGDVGDG